MLQTPPVGFIRQTVLNVKVVRIYFQIQVYVRSVILADARELIEKKREGACPTPQIALKTVL